MRLKNECSYYIPNLEELLFDKEVEYLVKEDDVFFPFILQQVSSSLENFFEQYPSFCSEEEMAKMLYCQKKFSRSSGLNIDSCYQYFGRMNQTSQGISIQEPKRIDLIPIKITATEVKEKEPVYQRRIELVYNLKEEYFYLKQLLEVERRNDKVVQSSFQSKTLRKVKKYIKY